MLPAAGAGLQEGSQQELPPLRWELSLKGAGATPYARGGDGRAALQSGCRELLGGAALAAVGVPTARALAVVSVGGPAGGGGGGGADGIVRDEWYTNRPERVTPGVLSRLAPTMLRFGSLQLAALRQGPAGAAAVARRALAALAALEAHGDAAGAAFLDRLGGARSAHGPRGGLPARRARTSAARLPARPDRVA